MPLERAMGMNKFSPEDLLPQVGKQKLLRRTLSPEVGHLMQHSHRLRMTLEV